MTYNQAPVVIGLVLNTILMGCYIWILSAGDHAPIWLLVPVLIWGFFGFRWIARELLGGTFMHVPVTFSRFFYIYLMGSAVCVMFGLLIIPVLMVQQVLQLAQMRK